MQPFQHDTRVVNLPVLMEEIRRAGLYSVPMTIDETGAVHFDAAVAEDVRQGVAAVLAKHNPVILALIAQAEALAAEAADNGFIEGIAMQTDAATEERLSRLAAYAARNPDAGPFRLMAIDGTFAEVPCAAVVKIADAVLAWRLACEGRLAAAIADIKTGRLPDAAAVWARFGT
jgi:hypothetical protein